MFNFISFFFLLYLGGTIPSIWIEIGSNLPKNQTSYYISKLNSGFKGQVKRAYLISSEDETDEQNYSIVYGPYENASMALIDVINILILHPDFRNLSLTHLDGSPVKTLIPYSQRRKLKLKSTKKPYPQKGISVTPRTLVYKIPYYKLPNALSSIGVLGYRDEIWLLKEKTVCNKGKCRRWFLGLTPSPYNLVWVPAGFVIPVSRIKSTKDLNGNTIKYTAVVWFQKTDKNYSFLAIRFWKNLPPYKSIFTLKRFFYLKLKKDESNTWLIYDRRGVVHHKLPKYSLWRPVNSIYKNSKRREFFTK